MDGRKSISTVLVVLVSVQVPQVRTAMCQSWAASKQISCFPRGPLSFPDRSLVHGPWFLPPRLLHEVVPNLGRGAVFAADRVAGDGGGGGHRRVAGALADREHHWARLARYALALLPRADGSEAARPRRDRRTPARAWRTTLAHTWRQARRRRQVLGQRQVAAAGAPPFGYLKPVKKYTDRKTAVNPHLDRHPEAGARTSATGGPQALEESQGCQGWQGYGRRAPA